MPPRAFTDPATGRSLSRLRNSRPPPRSAPYASASRAFIRGISVRADSMMPSPVSGNRVRISGAKRRSRAEASATSAALTGKVGRTESKGWRPGLIQTVSSAAAIRATAGCSAVSCLISIGVTPFLPGTAKR